ncbi:MAG: hypothetical protein ACLTJ5_05490 [Clostridium sp.]
MKKMSTLFSYIICCYGGLWLWKLLAGSTGEKAGFDSAKGTEK